MKKVMTKRRDSRNKILHCGEGERKDGIYYYGYTDSFTKKRRFLYAGSLEELRKKESELQRMTMDGLDYYLNKTVSINDVFNRFMKIKSNLKETTRSNYTYMYNHFVRDTGFGARKLSDVRYSDVKLYYQYLLNEKGLSINTLETVNNVLQPLFQMSVRDGVLSRNPVCGVLTELKRQNGKKNQGIRNALTVQQQKAFMDMILNTPEYTHWYPLFATLLGTGMRVGECIALRFSDIDFEQRRINVNHSATYYMRDGKACFAISTPKTNAGIRDIPMTDIVYNVLRDEYERQCIEGFCTYELDGVSGFIFSNRNGTLHNPHCINSAIRRIYEAHNAREIIMAKREHRKPIIIPHFSVHQLRHTFCSRLCEADLNIKVIQEIMGHVDSKTTMDVYTQISYEKKKQTMNELSKTMDLF